MNGQYVSLDYLAEKYRRGERLTEQEVSRLLTNGMNFLNPTEYARLNNSRRPVRRQRNVADRGRW